METAQIIKEQLELAPREIRMILESGSWQKEIDQISTINTFSSEQKLVLENEVLFVLLGMSSYLDFKQNLVVNLGIDDFAAINISRDVYEKVFKPVEGLLPTQEESKETSLEIPPEDLPAIVPGEGVHDVVHTTSEAGSMNQELGKVGSIPNNLPTDDNVPKLEEQNQELGIMNHEKEKPSNPRNPAYPEGLDPYREPIE